MVTAPEAENMFAEASRLADLRNGCVVDRALDIQRTRRVRARVKCCNFRENTRKFYNLHEEYRHEKRRRDRLKRRLYGDYSHVFAQNRPQAEQDYYECSVKCIDLKAELKKIYPCPNCIIAFNPTRKMKFMGHDFSETFKGYGPVARYDGPQPS